MGMGTQGENNRVWENSDRRTIRAIILMGMGQVTM